MNILQTNKIIYTIGFSKKSAREFFLLLKETEVNKLIDIRLNNKSQLAGFTKGRDLKYFLDVIAGITYEHDISLAPTKELLDSYKKGKTSWSEYKDVYHELLRERGILESLNQDRFAGACLLCSEATPDQCHRRLLAEYVAQHYSDFRIVHL